MLHGTVEYGFKAGGSLKKEFAVRAELVKDDADAEGGNSVMRLYQVYLVSVVFLCVWCGARSLRIWGLMLS